MDEAFLQKCKKGSNGAFLTGSSGFEGISFTASYRLAEGSTTHRDDSE